MRATYALPPGKRVILYAPTFAETARAARALEAGVLDLAEMSRVLGADHVLLLKVHPFVPRALDSRSPKVSMALRDRCFRATPTSTS